MDIIRNVRRTPEALLAEIEQFIIKFSESANNEENEVHLQGIRLPIVQNFNRERQQLNNCMMLANNAMLIPSYIEAEKQYIGAINLALQLEQYDKLTYCLQQLGDIYIQYAISEDDLITKQRYLNNAGAFYNRALCFCPTESISSIEEKIANVEDRFLTFIYNAGLSASPITYASLRYSQVNHSHKTRLNYIREEIRKRFNIIIMNNIESEWWQDPQRVKDIQELYRYSTQQMKSFIRDLLRECIAILGDAPCKFAVIAFGSTAREEMTPYSDLEWGILIDDDREENKLYFRTLTNLLHLKVINIGETTLRTMGITQLNDYNVGRKGFSFDGLMPYACKWPLGRPDIHNANGILVQRGFELICSPRNMLAYQTSPYYDRVLHFSTTLSCISAIEIGCSQENLDLVIAYKQFLHDLPPTDRQHQALSVWNDDMIRFELDIGEVSQAGKRYDVKKDIYRLPNLLIEGLGLYYALKSNSGWDKIDELAINQIIDNNAPQLRRLMSIVKALRLHVYLKSNNQRELLQTDVNTVHQPSESFCAEYSIILVEMYKIIIPFAGVISTLVKSQGEINNLKEVELYEDTPHIRGLIYYRLMNYQACLWSIFESLIEDHQQHSVWNSLGTILTYLGEHNLSVECYQYAHHFQSHQPSTAALHNLANAYGCLGNTDHQIKLLEGILARQSEGHTMDRAAILHSLANAYSIKGDADKQIMILSEVLLIETEYYKTRRHVKIAGTLNNLANAYGDLGDIATQRDLLEEALGILIEHYKTRKHLEITATLHSLSAVYGKLGNFARETELLEEALALKFEHYGTQNHVEVAASLVNLANVYGDLGDIIRKKELLEEVLAIQIRHYGTEENILVARTIQFLANAYGKLGDIDRQEGLLEKVLQIKVQFYPEGHIEIAITQEILAQVYGQRGDKATQKELLEKVLKIKIKHYGCRDNIDVANTLRKLATTHGTPGYTRIEGNISKRRELLEEALDIQTRHYQTREHIEVAETLRLLANTYNEPGSLAMQQKILEEALAIQVNHYKNRSHVDIATTLHYLSTIYGKMGNLLKEKELLEEALEIKITHYRTRNHVDVARTLYNLANVYGTLSNTPRQKELLEEALAIQTTYYQEQDHIEVTRTLCDLSAVYDIQAGVMPSYVMAQREANLANYFNSHRRREMEPATRQEPPNPR